MVPPKSAMDTYPNTNSGSPVFEAEFICNQPSCSSRYGPAPARTISGWATVWSAGVRGFDPGASGCGAAKGSWAPSTRRGNRRLLFQFS